MLRSNASATKWKTKSRTKQDSQISYTHNSYDIFWPKIAFLAHQTFCLMYRKRSCVATSIAMGHNSAGTGCSCPMDRTLETPSSTGASRPCTSSISNPLSQKAGPAADSNRASRRDTYSKKSCNCRLISRQNELGYSTKCQCCEHNFGDIEEGQAPALQVAFVQQDTVQVNQNYAKALEQLQIGNSK